MYSHLHYLLIYYLHDSDQEQITDTTSSKGLKLITELVHEHESLCMKVFQYATTSTKILVFLECHIDPDYFFRGERVLHMALAC